MNNLSFVHFKGLNLLIHGLTPFRKLNCLMIELRLINFSDFKHIVFVSWRKVVIREVILDGENDIRDEVMKMSRWSSDSGWPFHVCIGLNIRLGKVWFYLKLWFRFRWWLRSGN